MVNIVLFIVYHTHTHTKGTAILSREKGNYIKTQERGKYRMYLSLVHIL